MVHAEAESYYQVINSFCEKNDIMYSIYVWLYYIVMRVDIDFSRIISPDQIIFHFLESFLNIFDVFSGRFIV